MTALLLIRHGKTIWNEEGRIQGRADPPLSDRGRAEVESWALPAAAVGAAWYSSPLLRARQTAALLHGEAVVSDPRLAEADWGEWEGSRLEDLRRRDGEAMAANENRGLDFQPPGGESPRAVQDRVKPLLAELATQRQSVVAITHKGVIRAVFALASGWDMRDKPPVKLGWSCAHGFRLGPQGNPAVEALNIPLLAA